MNRNHIEAAARDLLKSIWEKKEVLWEGWQPKPVEMLCPKIACGILGLEYLELGNLGHNNFAYRGTKFKIAGLIDRQSKKIAVSTEFPLQEIRFTAAHEIGHWLLHPNEVMHRDRPLIQDNYNRITQPLEEREANYFAACFLMPARLLGNAFEKRFQTKLFTFDDSTAFHLNPLDPQSLISTEKDCLDRELALARCKSFNGNYFKSLSEEFNISESAMAIRLKELNLIKWP